MEQNFKLELADPDLHRFLMTEKAKDATKAYSDVELKKQAFLHVMFDVLSQRATVLTEIDSHSEKHQYLYGLMENAEIRKLWREGEIRLPFDDVPFQAHADKAFDEVSRRVEVKQG